MTRLVTTLVAVTTLLLPVLSVFGHTDTELVVSLLDQEVVVTGHEELDTALHIEKASGVLVRHCPECVLHKRHSDVALGVAPISSPHTVVDRVLAVRFERSSPKVSSNRSARAPPVV